MTKFYTRTGDDGSTGLLGDERVPKYHPRIEAVGSIDEASAAIGAARAICKGEGVNLLLQTVQRDLYNLMAEVAASKENAPRFRHIDASRVLWLEAETDRIGAQIRFPDGFILPGDTPASGLLALARTIVRRAERGVARLQSEGELENIELQRYLNRLSSLCFALELGENQAHGIEAPNLANPKEAPSGAPEGAQQ
jgi:cob(I)alamin adenosyltransferase